jgi:hypothetical protein
LISHLLSVTGREAGINIGVLSAKGGTPYGIVIAGTDMGTAQQSYLCCAAYGNGNFIVPGFGPEPFQANGRGEANDAVHPSDVRAPKFSSLWRSLRAAVHRRPSFVGVGV